MTDLRQALRALWRRPLLFAVAAGALALGIGASTAVFSVVDAVLLRPLPFAEPERLVVLWQSIPSRDAPYVAVSYPYFLEMRARSRSMAGLAAMPNTNSGFTIGGAEPVRVQGRLVGGNFFEVLGVRPARGRTFGEEDNKVGVPRVVVVSHGLWQRHFGGDPGLVGRTLDVDGAAMTVVGVMPREFRYPTGADLWTPVVPAIPEEAAKPNVAWAVLVGRVDQVDAPRHRASAITGGMAASDSLVQQVLGHGIAAKLSQRLGEGVLNGLLTARLGLAAIDVTRPLPFTALPRPVLGDLAKDLLRKRDAEE